jgi:hypothetical protein
MPQARASHEQRPMNHLVAALSFPRERHQRSSDPGPFSRYQSYKRHLQREFHRKCVYCRVADWKGYDAFGVDHYQPRSRFPALVATWSNLFYACNACNTLKGDSVSSPELFLPNPCEHEMAAHLQYRGADVETYTQHGRWLAELLDLAARRQLRELVLSALGLFLTSRHELLRDLATLEARLPESPPDRAGALLSDLRETSSALERVERLIEALTGEPIEA